MIQKVNELEIKEVTEEEYIEVLKWLFGENIEIFKEKDITLSKVYENPYMYYTKEINDLIQTKFMQRSKKILQLGTTNLEIPTSSNNRLQHAKGAAYRCLEFYAIQFRKSEWKHYIETNNLKKYLVEKLKYMYCHDIGHSMQSHSIEKVIGDIKCNHEIIGKKICLEDKEVVNALSNIKADESTSSKGDGTLESFCEGTIDFDRMDYLIRDMVFSKGTQYVNLPLILSTLVDLKDVQQDDKTVKKYVYKNSAIPYIEQFLQIRDNKYKTLYRSKRRKFEDTMQSYIIERIKNGQSTVNGELEKLLNKISGVSIEDVDLNEYLRTNDIFWINELIKIAENDENETTREIATYLIPNNQGLLQSALTMIDPEKRQNKKYDEEEKCLLKNISMIFKGKSPISDKVNSKDWRDSLVQIIEKDDKEEIEKIKTKIFEVLEIKGDAQGIKNYETDYKKYDFDNPIYVEDKDGKIYTFDKHPDRKMDLREDKRYGLYIIPIVLKEEEIDEDKIRQAINILNEKQIDR